MKGTKVYYKLRKRLTLGQLERFSSFEFTPNVTHVQVGMCPSDWDKEQIFEYFNVGEGLTSKGAQEKISKTPDLHHTSMSIGDVILTQDNKCYVCDVMGWRELVRNNFNFQEIWK